MLKIKLLYLSAILLIASGLSVFGQTSAFTYQGRFTDANVAQPTNGTYSMTFRLYDALTGGNQIGSAVTTSVSVVNGIFAAQLDFGAAAFDTTGARYLEIQVGASTLTPRQQITSTPFSIRANNAATADSLSANCNLCIQNGQLAANSVTTSKVANGTIINSKLTQDSVNSLNIIDNSIVNADINTAANIDGTKINGSTITNINASNLGSGTVPDARLSGNVTVQGNTFNGANQLVKLDGSGKLPAIDGSQLTNLPGGSAVTPFVVTSIPASSATYSLASYGTTATRVFVFSFGGAVGNSGFTVIITLPAANSYPAGTRIQVAMTDYITGAPTIQYQRTGTTDTLHGFNQGAGSGGPGFPGAFATWITDGSSNWYRIAS